VASESKRARARVLRALGVLGAVIASGALGFHLIEGWSLLDSLYFTVASVTTVGYGDLHPSGAAGRSFAIIFLLVGVGTVGFVLSRAIIEIVQSEIVAGLGQRRRLREVSRLRDHFIICGAGRVGSRVIRELQRKGEPFVIIERDADNVGDWLTYVAAAKRLNKTRSAIRQMAIRGKIQRVRSNDGKALVFVTPDMVRGRERTA